MIQYIASFLFCFLALSSPKPLQPFKQVSHYPPLRLSRTPTWGWRMENTNVIMREIDDVDHDQDSRSRHHHPHQHHHQQHHGDDDDSEEEEEFFDDDSDVEFNDEEEDDDDDDDDLFEDDDEDADLFADVMGVDHPNDMVVGHNIHHGGHQGLSAADQSGLQHGVVVDVDREAHWVPDDDDDALFLRTLAPHQQLHSICHHYRHHRHYLHHPRHHHHHHHHRHHHHHHHRHHRRHLIGTQVLLAVVLLLLIPVPLKMKIMNLIT
jgi:hypothetical protein